jgi:hypothetical protein
MLASLIAVLDRHPIATGWAGSVISIASLKTTLETADLFLKVGSSACVFLTASLTVLITLPKAVRVVRAYACQVRRWIRR